MAQWTRRVRGVLGMGLAWAIGGIGVAGVLELIDNVLPAAHGVTRLVDMWPQLLAMLGFVGGVLFALALGVAMRRKRFDQFTFPQFAGLGALAGAALATFALVTGGPIAIALILLVAGTLGGAGSLLVARVAERRGLLHAGARPADAALVDDRAPELLGRGD